MVISAAKELDAVRQASRQGVVDYVLKPFGFDDLRERLERYAARRAALDVAVVEGQGDIDRLLGSRAPGGAPQPLPKGMSVETAQVVERVLKQTEGTLSATECAEQAGLSRVSARRYLEHFCHTGQAEVRLRYGTTGRPERRYHWVS
jgi:response regulator of citrate/malate metabolism